MEQSFTEPYEGKNRLIVLFAPEEGDPRLKRQLDALMGQEEGLREREVFTFVVGGPGAVKAYGDGASGARLDPDVMRDRFDVPADAFRLVLIGKDGEVKRTESDPISAESLFQGIDAMPRRQEEMRQRRQ